MVSSIQHNVHAGRRVVSNWARLAPKAKVTNMGFFKDQFSVRFGSASQNVLKKYLKSIRVVPFGANMIGFAAKSDMLAPCLLYLQMHYIT